LPAGLTSQAAVLPDESDAGPANPVASTITLMARSAGPLAA